MTGEVTEKVVEENEFIDNIEKEFTIRPSYLLLLGFSAVIATLGLLTNSASVIIGSMLISPLFWPVLGISLSIVFSDRRLIRKAIYSMGVSILSVFLVSLLLTKILPMMEPSQEIMVRTNPTLIDLFIALAVSVIGILAIKYKGISQTATGVAISIALLPVLCVVGIGAALGSMDIFKGSFLLFLANAGAIVFVGATLMYFMGIRPKGMKEKEGFKKKYLISFVLLILLAIPLTYHLHVSLKQEKIKKQITNALEQKTESLIEGAKVQSTTVLFPPSFSKEKIKVRSIVFLPQGTTISASDQQILIDELSTKTKDAIDLEMSMFNMLSIRQDNDVQQEQLKKQIQDSVKNEIKNIDNNIKVDSVFVEFSQDDSEPIEISTKIQQVNDSIPLTFEQKQNINKIVDKALNISSNLTVEFIPSVILKEESEDVKLQQKITNVLEQDLATLSPDASVIDITVTAIDNSGNETKAKDKSDKQGNAENSDKQNDIRVVTTLFVPESVEVTEEYKDELLKHIEEDTDQKTELILQIVNFTNI